MPSLAALSAYSSGSEPEDRKLKAERLWSSTKAIVSVANGDK
jgi:hypothetical protein